MLEPVAATLIGKALDFIFDEVKSVLAERRARRAPKGVSSTAQTHVPEEENSDAMVVDTGTTKQDVLSWEIQRIAYEQREREIRSLVNQLVTHKENLNRSQEQAAKWGDASVPPFIANTILDEEQKILDKSLRLKRVLEAAYGRQIEVDIPASELHD